MILTFLIIFLRFENIVAEKTVQITTVAAVSPLMSSINPESSVAPSLGSLATVAASGGAFLTTVAPSAPSRNSLDASSSSTVLSTLAPSTVLATTTQLPTTTLPTTTSTTILTTTTTRTTTTLPYKTHFIFGPTVPQVPSKPTRPTPTTETTTTQDRPALRLFRALMTTERPVECASFSFSRLSKECCNMPRFVFSDSAKKICEKECEKSEGRHCCWTECVYREMGIYSIKKGFEIKGIVNGFSGEGDWIEVVTNSTEFCVSEQEEKKMTTIETTLTTDSSMTQSSVTSTLGLTTPQPAKEATIESLKERQEKNRYCNIPLYVTLLIPCVTVQNFANCPQFNEKSRECKESRELIRKCKSDLHLQYS